MGLLTCMTHKSTTYKLTLTFILALEHTNEETERKKCKAASHDPINGDNCFLIPSSVVEQVTQLHSDMLKPSRLLQCFQYNYQCFQYNWTGMVATGPTKETRVCVCVYSAEVLGTCEKLL